MVTQSWFKRQLNYVTYFMNNNLNTMLGCTEIHSYKENGSAKFVFLKKVCLHDLRLWLHKQGSF